MQLQSPAVSEHLLTPYKVTTADVELQLSSLETAIEEWILCISLGPCNHNELMCSLS